MPALKTPSKTNKKNPLGLTCNSIVDVRISDYETVRDIVKTKPHMIEGGLWVVGLMKMGCVNLAQCKRADPRTICKRCTYGFVEPREKGFCDACSFFVEQQVIG